MPNLLSHPLEDYLDLLYRGLSNVRSTHHMSLTSPPTAPRVPKFPEKPYKAIKATKKYGIVGVYSTHVVATVWAVRMWTTPTQSKYMMS